uniref:C-type lectin domain-containing protein n=1 Tax=Sinocyclocheilus anshuiensis TaxID=1608454 RepID=A0A671SRG8_9TELE
IFMYTEMLITDLDLEHRVATKLRETLESTVRGSRCLVLITVCFQVICVLLLINNILLSLSRKNLETRVEYLTAEKDQLQRDFDSLNKKGPVCFFMSTELKSWSESRQYCRDRGADLVIINTDEKQRFISSLVSERVWVGLSDTENEGIMKWVDNSTLKQGFWLKGEPNNYYENEDCIELYYKRDQVEMSPLNSWNDQPCSEKKKGICEK